MPKKTMKLSAWFFAEIERPKAYMPYPYNGWRVISASIGIFFQSSRNQADVTCETSSGSRFVFKNVPLDTDLEIHDV